MAMDEETNEELCPAPLPACPDWLFDVRKGDLDERVASRTTASGRPEPFLSLSFSKKQGKDFEFTSLMGPDKVVVLEKLAYRSAG